MDEHSHTPPLTERRSYKSRDAVAHNVKLVGRVQYQGGPDGCQTRQPPGVCSTHQASQANTGVQEEAEARAGDLLDGLTGFLVTWRPAGPFVSPLGGVFLRGPPRPRCSPSVQVRPPRRIILTPLSPANKR